MNSTHSANINNKVLQRRTSTKRCYYYCCCVRDFAVTALKSCDGVKKHIKKKKNMFAEMGVRFPCLRIIVAFLLLQSECANGQDNTREPRFRFPDGTSTESGVAGLVRRQLANQAAILGRLTGSNRDGLDSGQTFRLAAGKGPFIGWVLHAVMQ